jgi:glyoxylase-like metal-dependent hydrolase (beta-lactamase superfamily II)
MYRSSLTLMATCALLLTVQPGPQGQPAAQTQTPQIETTLVDGTDNVYIFRYGGRQSMFIVTDEGVIATDPAGYGVPDAGDTYVAEIRKVTSQPIRYLIYSHHHFDHIAGGAPLKAAGARVLAHRKAVERLTALDDPNTVLPDEAIDDQRTITLGGTTLELTYVGLNHSDSTLVMRLPQERIVFVVDLLPVGTVPGRGLIDFYPLEAEAAIERILAMDWDRLIPGHPGAGGRLGTKQDAQDQLTFLRDVSAAVKVEAQQGRCWEPAESTMQIPKYASWPGYEANLQFALRRYCALWGRGT